MDKYLFSSRTLNEGRNRLHEVNNSSKETDCGFDIILDVLLSVLR